MERANRPSQTIPRTPASLSKERKMGVESSDVQMVAFTTANSPTIKSTGMECTPGLVAFNTQAPGKITKSMVQVVSNGLMAVANTLANSEKMRDMVKAPTLGSSAPSGTADSGAMARRMESGLSGTSSIILRRRDSGSAANLSNGCQTSQKMKDRMERVSRRKTSSNGKKDSQVQPNYNRSNKLIRIQRSNLQSNS